MIEIAAVGHYELVALGIVIAQQVLSAAHVTEVQEDVLVADRPEIRAGVVVVFITHGGRDLV
jgi:hypothetical protein